MPKLVGLQQAKRLVLLADMIDADEARTLGLVTRGQGGWTRSTRSSSNLRLGWPQAAVALAQSKALLNDGANATTLHEAL